VKALFLIEAPFQLLSANEAIAEYNISEYIIYIRLSLKKKNDLQLKKLVNILFNNSNNIEYFTLKADKKNILDLFKIFYMNIYCAVLTRDYKYIFVGNLDSKVLKLMIKGINKNKIILLDDGIKNILLQNNFTEKNHYNIFTMLLSLNPYKNQRITYNKFKEFKKSISDMLIERSKDILFVGIDLCESRIMNERDYISYIDKISNRENRSIIYIPHRSEDNDKLNRISKLANVKIDKIDYPIEFYFYNRKVKPYKIMSFYSGALISLKCLYSDIEIVALQFDYQNVSNSKDIDLVYSYLNEYVKVETIEI
jgi:hypothetical protein